MSPEDRAKLGRWLDNTSASARHVERHHAADRVAVALAEWPEMAERARLAVLVPDAVATSATGATPCKCVTEAVRSDSALPVDGEERK